MDWENLIEYESLRIQKQFAGEIRFGPTFFSLNSNPEIKELNSKIFGDWFYKHNSTIYLQQWNSTRNPDINLISINIFTLEYKIVLENIKSVFGKMRCRNNQLYFVDKYNKKEYLITAS
ncbi:MULTISPECIES: hypothetical protein [Empedobacter]|uniref:Uncharacterized protein n=1 Tax=Empedobacter falsenii TaxID=343874 RepID=A0A376G2P6_9FLAO|nr:MULTISPECIES: hypothetical protein [Empedobacter]MBW1617442.1 hypothetical protein [Empedobacter falsenii]STD53793.1 Uncharacterised protein [Empedobacter falsenii]